MLTVAGFVDFEASDRFDLNARVRFDGQVSHDDERRYNDHDDHYDHQHSCCGPEGYPGLEGKPGRNGRNGRDGRVITRDFGQVYNLPNQFVPAAVMMPTPPTAGKFIDFSSNGLTEDIFHTPGSNAVFVEKAGYFFLTASVVAAGGPSVCSIFVDNVALSGAQYSFVAGSALIGAVVSPYSLDAIVPLNDKSKVQLFCRAPSFGAPALFIPALAIPNANLVMIAL